LPTVPLRLWRSDAILLFDLLMRIDLDSVPFERPADEQAKFVALRSDPDSSVSTMARLCPGREASRS
jgi:hypothetical protein